jgi:hypothetical protein
VNPKKKKGKGVSIKLEKTMLNDMGGNEDYGDDFDDFM